MSTLSQEAALVHEALLARGLETPLRAPVRDMDDASRKREIAGHMARISRLPATYFLTEVSNVGAETLALVVFRPLLSFKQPEEPPQKDEDAMDLDT